MGFNSAFKGLNKTHMLKGFWIVVGFREALTCELDWSGSVEGLRHEYYENDKKQLDFVRDIEILD